MSEQQPTPPAPRPCPICQGRGLTGATLRASTYCAWCAGTGDMNRADALGWNKPRIPPAKQE